MSMSTLGPTGEAVGDLPMVGEKVTMTLANPDKKHDDAVSSITPDLSTAGTNQGDSIRSDSSFAAGAGVGSARTSPGPKGQQRQTCMVILAVVLVACTVSLIVGLSVGLTRVSSSRSSSSATSGVNPFGVPTVGPASPPGLRPVAPPPPLSPTNLARRQQAMQFLLDSNFAKESDLNNISTPQARALTFLVLGNTIPTIPTLASSEAEQGNFLDRWVAMVLYYSTGGDRWIPRWNVATTDRPVCSWNGVMRLQGVRQPMQGGFFCQRQNNRIARIHLESSGLAGTLPTELGLLTDLIILDLSINNIAGSIPFELANCRQLRVFELSFNQLQGSVPAEIGAWSELQYFSVSNNMLRDSIPDGFRSLVKLESLALDDNLFTGTLDNLNPLTNLQNLLLEDNAFTGDLTPLQSLDQLRFLDASNNKLEGDIPAFLFNLQDLLVLDLHGNKLTGEIPSGIEPNDRLLLLALQRNDGFTGEIPPSMTNLQALTHLDLTSTSFTGDMPTFLGNMTELRYLFLADTQFDDGPIPDEYQALTLLRDLSLKDSSRTGEIPTWIGRLNRLLLLDLDANRLVGNIPTEIGNLEFVIFLFLNRNELTGAIPSEISNLTDTLRGAFFDHNELEGSAEGACNGLDRSRTLMTSDCNATGSGPNDFVVMCPCCNLCCVSSDESCNEGDYLAQFDPIWETAYQRISYDFTRDFNITRI